MPAKKSKSIFRQPGARKFQLVHRSQRDPLIHDPEASTHVLKAVGERYEGKGKGKAKVDPEDDIAGDEDDKFGEAALYGVYYDDADYDYMQHLRPVGLREDGVDSVWVEASSVTPTASTKNKKGRLLDSFLREDRDRGNDSTSDIPSEALPSRRELSRAEAQLAGALAVPEELTGLQPDMDPHLRQALEALDDDAFVVAEVRGVPKHGSEQAALEKTGRGESDVEGEEVLDDADDFFAELVAEGEREEGEEAEWEFRDEGVDEDYDDEGDAEEDESWEARFKRFQLAHKARKTMGEGGSDVGSEDDDGAGSEGRDTVGQLPRLPVIGGKRRRKGTSDASGYSMSSSSMFRNEGLTLLDERFDQVEKDYLSDPDSDFDDGEDDEEDDDETPDLITSREDFNAIMDDFLDNYEIIGGKMREVMPGETALDKFSTFREGLRENGLPINIPTQVQQYSDEDDTDEIPGGEEDDDVEEKWDVETVLSTYSNLANHPKVIRASRIKNVTKIAIDPKTGLPSVVTLERKKTSRQSKGLEEVQELPEPRSTQSTITRPKDETKDEKRARKQAVKEERQARRQSKKTSQTEFADEKKKQIRERANAPAKGVRKL